MKKILLSIIILVAASLPILGADHLVERTYLSTDRDCYVAGDRVWCSAFCVDAATGGLSGFSSIAYVELRSADGLVQTTKIALQGGRGAGFLEIPANTPTGNYRLFAYTAQNVNEDGYDFLAGSKLVSVFNTFSTERVTDGVEVVETLPAAPAEPASALRIVAEAPEGGIVPLRISGFGRDATLSVSVYHDDGFSLPEAPDIRSFVTRADVSSLTFTDRRLPEYDGEIVYGHVAGVDPAELYALEGKFAFISVPGDRSDTYSCQLTRDGRVTFFTNNFYGQKDLVCQIEGLESTSGAHLEIESPFVEVPAGDVPKLRLSPSMSDRLKQRSVAMQIEKMFDADTLFEFLPVRDNLLFGGEGITYVLDDYTRLPLMEECIVEFISELRARKEQGRRDLQVRLQDYWRLNYFARGSSLMMVDGVPVFDHETIYRYDPLLVETVNIYPYTYFIGTRGYSGVANFVTYKQNLPSVTFPDNVRILVFQGAAYPVAYTCKGVGKDYPDYRQTVLWEPVVSAEAGETISLDCVLPAYKGSFRVVVEGLSSTGEPIRATASFDVR